ncbi:MAG: hypothetical protein O3C40_14770 [Planctomycetota bacterium]|nr:hypothetical protein [Planctomycetota bacterium]
MKLRWSLLCWQLRQVSVVTIAAMLLSVWFVLTYHDPLKFDIMTWAPFFILAHCSLLTWRLGRVRSRSFGFLYGQGFSRDTLWLHTMLASGVSVLAVWLPAALLVWSGLRSDYQEMMQNYWFPLMAETEGAFILWSLLAYAVLLPVFHYCWIRAAQPTRGTTGGFAIAIGAVFGAFSIWNSVRVPDMPTWTVLLFAGGFVLATISLSLGGMRLHRRLEVI